MPKAIPVNTVQLRGIELGTATAPATTPGVTITRSRRVQLGTGVRDATQPPMPPLDVALDEVVRVEFDNGLSLWMRADDLLRERGQLSIQRDAAEGQVFEIDAAPRAGVTATTAGTRGLLGLGIKALEFFGVDVVHAVASELAGAFERKQLKGHSPGLYRANLQAGVPLQAVPADAKLPVSKPWLLFLHGSMSSFEASYGPLRAGAAANDAEAGAAHDARQALQQAYGEQILAFEHLSLTHSPIQNALQLAQALPEDAVLHVVSHSRGGLVAELLCLAQRDRSSDPLAPGLVQQLFASDRTGAAQPQLLNLTAADEQGRAAAYQADAQRLQELLLLLDTKRICVQRFVRVACPARGTTLASGRLDRWLSVVDMLAGQGLFGEVADFLLAVVKERSDPRTMPGIEAMMPGSALTRLLQLPGLQTSADLSVIAGDVEGDSLWSKLKWLATDWFFGDEHDLVVNTGSMCGGLRRTAGAARWLQDHGPQVQHFRYFKNATSLRWLVKGLLRADNDHGGFSPIEQARTAAPRWRSAALRSQAQSQTQAQTQAQPRPIVVLVPGIMGSELALGEQRVWLNYESLLRGGLAKLSWDEQQIQVQDVLDDGYGPLLEHLAREHLVDVLPYDWRRSVRDVAKSLAQRLDALLPEAERTGQPLHIVAHSTGGLVARAMIADGGKGTELWQRMGRLKGGSRLLMLGTPNQGSFEAVRWLTGCNATQAKLSLLDWTQDVDSIINIVRQYPGMVELLPFDQAPGGAAFPFANGSPWRQLKKALGGHFALVDPARLTDAAVTWQLLRRAPVDTQRMRYVAGCQGNTVVGYRLPGSFMLPGPQRIEWLATAQGDGTVSWASGKLPQLPMYFAEDTGHGELCSNSDDKRLFRAYVDLLGSGHTDQLSTTPPWRTRAAGGDASAPLPLPLPALPLADSVPDEALVRSLSWGGGAKRRRASTVASSAITVSVRHGDLAYARHAVLVGHYIGDTIVSAEAALDARLGGALTRRRDLGLYPGPHGSHAVFFNEDKQGSPSGAVVVGLGEVGALSPSRLQGSVRDAMLEYALRLLQQAGARGATPEGAPESTPESTPEGTPKTAPDAASTTGRRSAKLSCLLVGSGGAGLTPRESVEAILRATLDANRRLEASHVDHKVLIQEIEFIELYEDVAISTARSVRHAIDASDIGKHASWQPNTLIEGAGRRQRRYYDSDRSWDQRIEIMQDPESGMLKFSVATQRARNEEVRATGQVQLADLFVARASSSASADPEVSRTLFELLLPTSFKDSAPDQRDMVLVVDAQSARFPWELLEDRWSLDGRPPAIEAGIVRQFKTTEFRSRPNPALEETALVVGNPDLTGSTRYADLPGARDEAAKVRDQLRLHFLPADVSDLIDAKADTIIAALHRRPWRVLHLAGHGDHEHRATPDSPPQSGMVIGQQAGQPVFLTPGDVAQMRFVPELVFINCCHLGKTQSVDTTPARAGHHFGRLAANLGAEFIQMGVRAVVCAGWAVDDAAALTFAQAFYRELLGGSSFRNAVKAARRAAYSQHPDCNTWGAYHCYGDPGWRLMRDGDNDGATLPNEYVSHQELVVDLNNLAEWARVQTQQEAVADENVATRQRAEVQRLHARAPAALREGWLQRADVAAATGFAYAEALLFDEAITAFDLALAARQGDCPVRVFEQCANLRVRQAVKLADALKPEAQTSATQRSALAQRIEAAIVELDVVYHRAATPERLSLLGGACKRLALLLHDAAPRQHALLRMAQYYRRALDMRQGDDAYSLSNWSVACLLLERLAPQTARGHWHTELQRLVQQQIERSAAHNASNPDFWEAVGLADLQLVQLLMSGPGAAAGLRDGAMANYRAALARGASPREIGSVHEHIRFVVDITAIAGQPDWPAAVRQALLAVQQALATAA
jgi:CHAT domain